jgi:transcription elongation factor SPT5
MSDMEDHAYDAYHDPYQDGTYKDDAYQSGYQGSDPPMPQSDEMEGDVADRVESRKQKERKREPGEEEDGDDDPDDDDEEDDEEDEEDPGRRKKRAKVCYTDLFVP